jgi:TetR/AcrR family transcriptional regulator, mexJK operon transcriptional repressor
MVVGSDLALKESVRQTRRGRPNATRAAQIDQSIRDAAHKLFLEVGFGAASMDAIAAAAPVSKGTLYARYQSKEELFRKILEDALENLSYRAGELDHLLPKDLEQRLRQHARTLIASTHFGEFDRVRKLVDSAQLTFPDIAALWHDLAVGRYVDFLAEDMAASAELPAGAKVDWPFLANLFLHSIGSWQDSERRVRAVSDAEIITFADKVIAMIVMSLPKRADTIKQK